MAPHEEHKMERKFTRALSKPGTAAQARENVCHVVRESMIPRDDTLEADADWETRARLQWSRITCDDQRDILLIPNDDINYERIKRDVVRTEEEQNLATNATLARACVEHYCDDDHVIVWKDTKYAGSVWETASIKSELKALKYECDADTNECIIVCETKSNNRKVQILCQESVHFIQISLDDKTIEYKELIESIQKVDHNKIKVNEKMIEFNEEKHFNEFCKFCHHFNHEIDLQTIARENDVTLNAARAEARVNIFNFVNFDLSSNKDSYTKLRDTFNNDSKNLFRFILHVRKLEFDLRLNDGHVEPYFTCISLFDAKHGKISEDFRFDLNDDRATHLLPTRRESRETKRGFDQIWLSGARTAIFEFDESIHQFDDLFLVLRVEKLLQLTNIESYLHVNNKTASRVHKQTQNTTISRMQPFVWATRPLFKMNSSQLDLDTDIGPFYKQDSTKLSDDDVLRFLNNQSLRSNTVIGGKLVVKINKYNAKMPSRINPLLYPVSQLNTKQSPALHIQYLKRSPIPNQHFIHVLYVYPRLLKFDSQKVFSKARNICVTIEMRDDDHEGAQPLQTIFGGPHEAMFVSSATTAVSRHQVTPDFYKEVKFLLPVNVHDKHHILFSFSHVSCKRDSQNASIPVGFAWIPLNKFLHCDSLQLSICCSLPSGYLSCQQLGLGKGFSGPEVRWCARDAFKVQLRLVSTVMSRDSNLQAIMSAVTRITNFTPEDSRDLAKIVATQNSLPKLLKTIVDCDKCELKRFSHVIMSQMLRLLVVTTSEQVAECAATCFIQLLGVFPDWESFVEKNNVMCSQGDSHVHEQLVKWLNVLSNEFATSIIQHLGFLFRLLLKAMIQYIHVTSRTKMHREQRFSRQFSDDLSKFVLFVSSSIVQMRREPKNDTKFANECLGHFLSRMASFSDRGFVFTLMHAHLTNCANRDIVAHEMRLHFIAIVTAHEHHIPLNLPLSSSMKLTREFSHEHFSVAILLHELRHSLSQVRHVRTIAVRVVRNLLAKHSFDDRYQSRGAQVRIASLYLPLVDIIIDNLNRITCTSSPASTDTNMTPKHERRATFHEGSRSYWSMMMDSVPLTHHMFSIQTTHEEKSHTRHHSLPIRMDKFHADEVNDLLVCLFYVLGSCAQQTHWLSQQSPQQSHDLFVLLETALHVFKYSPISSSSESRAKTLPTSINESREEIMSGLAMTNLSTQVAIIVLDVIHMYINMNDDVSDPCIERIFEILLTLLSLPQSESLLLHLFPSIRIFITKFPSLFFDSNEFLAKMCHRLIHCCNSRLPIVRNNACATIFTLLATNLKITGSVARTHLQLIVGVSRVSSDSNSLLNCIRFYSSLNRLNQLALDDHNMKSIVMDTTNRIRAILNSTQQIRLESRDQERANDLRLQLARSYTTTSPALRRTWLETLAKVHEQSGDWAEAAMCLCHVLAIICQPAQAQSLPFLYRLSENIERDETEITDWSESASENQSNISLVVQECVQLLERAELFELVPHVLRVMVAWHEKNADHENLAKCYTTMALMHTRALEANRAGKRLLGTYFRVAFFGTARDDNNENEFIYKVAKVVSLAEMVERMRTLYSDKFENFHVLTDAHDLNQLDSTHAHILITHVTPIADSARDEFERNNGIKQFVFEQPFTRDGGTHAQHVSQQFKKRVILTCSHAFPYCLKRIPVVARDEVVLAPIEVAIDEMRARTRQLEDVANSRDPKRVQLVLQGSIHVTVNAGPIAYARAFLTQDSPHVSTLKHVFRQFVRACENALATNAALITCQQSEYHATLTQNLLQLKNELQQLNINDDMNDDDKRTSLQIFDAIGATSIA